ncbi:Uncharacterised protein [Bordetella pertussis]|nr:Uncharacterised protein [Bordetella pertussis]
MPRRTRIHPSTRPVAHWGSTSSGSSHTGVWLSEKLFRWTAAKVSATRWNTSPKR